MASKPLPIQLDASSAECLVFTDKEGLLSPVAHDLKIRVTKFELTWDGVTLTARFDPRSLRVVNALKRGREDPEALGEGDKAKIEHSMATEVLEARRYPKIEFSSTEIVREGQGFRIKGEVVLHGVTKAIRAKVSRRGDRWFTQAVIHQPDYGIRPFTAMLGTLKVKPKLRVRLSVAAADVPEAVLQAVAAG